MTMPSEVHRGPNVYLTPRFPESLDDLSVVMCWSGKGNRIIGKWDTMFDNAPPHAPYINGWALSTQIWTATQLGDRALLSATRSELDPAKTIEMSVPDWENPEFAKQFTKGVLFSLFGRSQKSRVELVARDVYEAFDVKSMQRYKRAREAGTLFEDPLDTVEPFVRLLELPGPPA